MNENEALTIVQQDLSRQMLAAMVSDRANAIVLNALYEQIRNEERARMVIFYAQIDKVKDTINILDRQIVVISAIIRLAQGEKLVNELKGADDALLQAFNNMRKEAAVLGRDVETDAPDCVALTHELVTLIGDILKPNALNPLTPNEGARQFEALMKRYNPDFPKLLDDIGRPPDTGRLYLVQRVRELKHAYKQNGKGLIELGRAIYEGLKRKPKNQRADNEQAALILLSVYCDPLNRDSLNTYMKGLSSDAKKV